MHLKHFYAHNIYDYKASFSFFSFHHGCSTTGISLFILHSMKLGAPALLLTFRKDKPRKICITTVAYLLLSFHHA